MSLYHLFKQTAHSKHATQLAALTAIQLLIVQNLNTEQGALLEDPFCIALPRTCAMLSSSTNGWPMKLGDSMQLKKKKNSSVYILCIKTMVILRHASKHILVA